MKPLLLLAMLTLTGQMWGQTCDVTYVLNKDSSAGKKGMTVCLASAQMLNVLWPEPEVCRKLE